MNEKKKPGVSEYGHPEYVTSQFNTRILEILLRMLHLENINMLLPDKAFS